MNSFIIDYDLTVLLVVNYDKIYTTFTENGQLG